MGGNFGRSTTTRTHGVARSSLLHPIARAIGWPTEENIYKNSKKKTSRLRVEGRPDLIPLSLLLIADQLSFLLGGAMGGHSADLDDGHDQR